jgi:hypothetical protein
MLHPFSVYLANYLAILRKADVNGKNGQPDHFVPILVDQVNTLVFGSLPIISHSGEGRSKLLVFPVKPNKSNKFYLNGFCPIFYSLLLLAAVLLFRKLDMVVINLSV